MLDLHHIFAVQKRALFFACTLRIRLGIYPYQTVFAGIAVGAFFGTYNFGF